MFNRTKPCKMPQDIIQLNNFFYIFDLRQGTILIAVHQMALSFFLLVILLVGISHVGGMMSMLHNDMEDDAERRGFYEVTYGEHLTFHEGDILSTNNQRRFANAQHRATVTVMILYTSTILVSIYIMCCISLLRGAIKYKREYVLPWIVAACVGVVLVVAAIVIGDGYPYVVNIFGGHSVYRVIFALFVLTYIYAIFTVSSFALSTGQRRRTCGSSDERGERLLLLDHTAHSSLLLSAAQLNKLQGTRSQFV